MHPRFDDLFDWRVGEPDLTLGVGPSQVARLSTAAQWTQKAEQLRELYRWTLGAQPAEFAQTPLDFRVESEQAYQNCTRRTVSYLAGPDERIRAEVLIPRGQSQPGPAVLTIHPTNANGRMQTIGEDPSQDGQDRAYGLHLAQRGYVTFSYDIDSTHDRLYPGAARAFDNTPLYDRYPRWSARGKDLHDVSRALDAMALIPEIDVSRIGCLGHSQGGGITTDAMILEPRIAAGVNNCGDWPFRLSRNPFNRCRTGWWIGQPALRPFAAAGKPMPMDLHEKLALAAPRPQMVLVSLSDFGFTLADEWLTRPTWENLAASVRELYTLLGVAEAIQFELHQEGHSFKAAQREIAYRFLDQHLR